jgi:serine/threonine protein kinase
MDGPGCADTVAPTVSFTLVIRTSDGLSKELDLATAKLPSVVGRDSELSQVVVVDSQISRAHAKLAQVEGGLAVEDLASRNGTWLNGQRISKGVLKPGDTLRLGTTQFTLEEIVEGEPDPLEGTRLGGFELQEAVGKGHYGTVYRALQVALGRPVAVKVLSPECAQDPERVKAFLAEARRAGRLNHPNLVQVHDVVQQDDKYLLIMELMSQSAGDILRDDGPFPEEELIKVVRDIAKALNYAESQRLVHRDVKPDNILVNEEGVYKLADLGIATPIADDGQARQDRIFGSPHYVAPEQAKGAAIDGRADLYALGASAWHLVTGEPLFNGTSRQIVAAHINDPIPDLRKAAPKLSGQMVEIIVKLLEKTPDKRYANAQELVTQMDRIVMAKARSTVPLVPRRRIRRRRRRYR